jgi:hypothetical protein
MRRGIVVAEFENVFGLLRSRGTNERRCKERRKQRRFAKRSGDSIDAWSFPHFPHFILE